MQDYYKNINEHIFNNILDIKNNFDYFKCYYRSSPADFYFWGIKKSNNKINYDIIDYTSVNVVNK